MFWNLCVVLVLILPPLIGGIFIEVTNVPIDFVVIRANSIPSFVKNEESSLKAGITGSDIIWEAGDGKDVGEEIPIYELNPDAKKSCLYIGVTDKFYWSTINPFCAYEDPVDPVKSLSGISIATKYQRITREVLEEKSVGDVKIIPVIGTDEAMQYVLKCEGILGILSSGKTAQANDIRVLEIFYDVTIRMIEAKDKLTQRDLEILDELKNRIAVAVQRRRMI